MMSILGGAFVMMPPVLGALFNDINGFFTSQDFLGALAGLVIALLTALLSGLLPGLTGMGGMGGM